jgi:oxygen-independent coproporphyrinogen III oxidase
LGCEKGIEKVSVSPEQAKVEQLGLYLHVPFCASTCDFCAFYQVKPTADSVNRFLAGVAREAELIEWKGPVTTVFWGGGTPGMLAPADLGRLAEIVRSRAPAPIEWTVELAPASVTPERLAALRAAGVTRVSLGVQSFQSEYLEGLGRQHTREQVYRAYERIRAVGFDSVNLDLMFALPGQTQAEWIADLRAAIALAPDHLSTYCLTFEEDTAMWLRLAQGRAKIDPVKEALFHEAAWSELAAAGYQQYEISNYARTGHACLHNLNTWRMGEWVGLGPSAASQYASCRGSNVADLERWLVHLDDGERMTEDRTALTPALLAEDALIFGLRANAGVDLAEARARWPQAPWKNFAAVLDRLTEEGLALREGERVRLTARGRLLADAIGAELIGLGEA